MPMPPSDAILNPYTPMAFLKPSTATKFTNQNYAVVGSVAVLLWDIILHLPQDYKLAARYRINISFIIYCIARVASLAYLLGFAITTTAPVGNCDYIRQISILYPFTIPLTIVPFVIRVSTLYKNNKYVITFFSLSWLSVLGSCIAVPIGASGINIGTTKYCFDTKTKIATTLSVVCPFIHNSLIFLATSWALMRGPYSDVNTKNGTILGKHLLAFSKSILRDGQFYYLATLILNLFFVALYHIPRAVINPSTLGIPVFVLLNTMSSYVYRNLRFGNYRDCSNTSSVIDKAFPMSGQSSRPHHEIVFKNSTLAKRLDTGRDPEAGDASETEGKGGELAEDVGSSRTEKGELGGC